MIVTPPGLFAAQKKKREKRKIPMGKALRSAIEKQMGVIGFAINQLMSRGKIPFRLGNDPVVLEPEQRMSIEFADKLRLLTQDYYDSNEKSGLRGVWCHVANEREAGWLTMLILRGMGMLAGAPDYWFVWPNGGGLIELKVDSPLSPAQQHFQSWATSYGVKYAVCYSVEAAIDALIEWGAIIGIPRQSADGVTTKET